MGYQNNSCKSIALLQGLEESVDAEEGRKREEEKKREEERANTAPTIITKRMKLGRQIESQTGHFTLLRYFFSCVSLSQF